eukprot:Protomagalhaensia_wolfi_Nauph_80__1623@NODE_1_length_8074_cov_174_317237_g0_i0_p4_GENE_NODE_1_length_8074_cov_174_317237_g0_i0NODE_1_length_8074_cov_174_317237_g0_i0_p4_ORF_typecomplete_len234_score22_54SEP/PF08059_13/7_6e22UBX/PF00789_20/6_3e15_NODE_1_length_8074_cov_174_317237_g0_i042384939
MFKSLRDLVTGQRPSDEDERQPERTFAGGERSGIAIEHPMGPNEARQSTTVLKLYRNGFILEDGPFRPFSDPANKRFIEDIEKGEAPEELRNRARDGGIMDMSLMDCRDRDYEVPAAPPTPTYTLFGGEGHSLSGNTPTSTTNIQSIGKGSVQMDQSLPTTTVAFRFPNGARTVETFNTTSTIGALRQYVTQSIGSSNYQLLSGFPPKPLSCDDSSSLESAGLLNASIIVKTF